MSIYHNSNHQINQLLAGSFDLNIIYQKIRHTFQITSKNRMNNSLYHIYKNIYTYIIIYNHAKNKLSRWPHHIFYVDQHKLWIHP